MARRTAMARWAATTMLAALMGVAAPASTAAPDAVPPAATGKPNILFVLVDDMGFGDLSIMGNQKVQTPNLDRLAREGVLMTQFYDAAPICSASRAGLLTGRFPAEVGFINYVSDRAYNRSIGQADWLDPGLPNIARLLKGAGYDTTHIGKWHLGGGRDIAEDRKS